METMEEYDYQGQKIEHPWMKYLWKGTLVAMIIGLAIGLVLFLDHDRELKLQERVSRNMGVEVVDSGKYVIKMTDYDLNQSTVRIFTLNDSIDFLYVNGSLTQVRK